jgi:hypothetical protein
MIDYYLMLKKTYNLRHILVQLIIKRLLLQIDQYFEVIN